MPDTSIKTKKEKKKKLFLLLSISLFVHSLLARIFRTPVITFLKLSIQLLYIYGNLVKAWFTICSDSLFLSRPFYAIWIYSFSNHGLELMHFGLNSCQTNRPNYRNYSYWQTLTRVTFHWRTWVIFDNLMPIDV